MKHTIAIAMLSVVIVSGAGCPADSSSETPGAALTYHRDIMPLLTANCVACHSSDGAAPFPLTTYEEVSAVGAAVATAVTTGTMPPWRADDRCRDFLGQRGLAESDKAMVSDWVAAGMPEGDPADAPEVLPPTVALEEASVVTRSAQPYTPDPSTPDDYRCLVMDVDFTSDTYITAYQVVPDVDALVHHVVLFLIPPSGAAAVADLDAQAPGVGYPCFGDAGGGGQPMGVWVPGSQPQRFPADSAFVLEAGAKIVAQVHYNVLGGALEADQTELHLATTDTAPSYRVTMPVLSGFFTIDAGDPAASVEFELPITYDSPKQLFSVLPHMHLLGSDISLERERDGQSECIVDVHDWAFDWQEVYRLRDDDFVELAAGDTLRYRCTYDNSAENQPVVNGRQRTPIDVQTGEGTLDEMCVLVVGMIEPYVPDAAVDCSAAQTCYASCPAGDASCFLGCVDQSGLECAACLLPGMASCNQTDCADFQTAQMACLATHCVLDITDFGAIRDCLTGPCAGAYQDTFACLEPHLEAGACSSSFTGCGFSFMP